MNKLVTFYSDSHFVLYNNYFLYSYNKYLSKKYELFVKKINQLSPSGEWSSVGFDMTMIEKIKWILENIDLTDNNFLIFSDCDVQFFNDLEFDISEYDILFQHDFFERNFCAGFFICKQNKKVLNFFELVYENFIKSMNGVIDDQFIINKLLNNTNNLDLNFGTLPSTKFWNVAFSTNGKVWDGEDINIPDNILMHHANFTIGIKNKINLMDLVKNKLNKNDR